MSDSLERDALVELLDQYTDVYPLSPTGARGWVRAKRELSQLDPEVYIEWDKNHWRYHGEPDGWTFEHHFRPVDDAIPEGDDFPDMQNILTEAQRKVDAERCPSCGDIHTDEDFLHTLMQAQEEAVGSDGYFMITLTPKQVDDYTVYEPEIYSHTLNDAAKEMIEAQLVHIASQLFQSKVLEDLRQLEGGDFGR